MTNYTNPSEKRRSWLRSAISTLLFVAILSAAGVWVFRGVGCWLVVEDPLQPADAIAVLSGGLPYRGIEAAKIYRQGLAPEVWLTRPGGPVEEMAHIGLEYTTEEIYSAEVLEKLGVPANAIHLLPDPIINTADEVRQISNELLHRGKSRVIIVTSPPHTRRVRVLWRKLVGSNLQAIVQPAEMDPYDADHWWRNTRDTLAVTREIMGLLNVWAGLPVRAATP